MEARGYSKQVTLERAWGRKRRRGGGDKEHNCLIFSRRKISMKQSQHYSHSAIESIIYSAIESIIDSF